GSDEAPVGNPVTSDNQRPLAKHVAWRPKNIARRQSTNMKDFVAV
ncbi:hypothetical protein A2U01_0104163, partial [Trifolium medium]|nr:hypothetical protein [Trifolium medium]